MKSFLIIGMGRFGSHLCQNLAKLGNEVMIIDQNEELLEPLLPYVTDAKIGDCTKEEVLKSLGVGTVLYGTFFRDIPIGVDNLVSTVSQQKFCMYISGSFADHVFCTKFFQQTGDFQTALKICAVQYSSDNVFDYFELSEDFSIYELAPLPEWIGNTIVQMDIRNKYHTNIVAIQTKDGIQAMPPADYRFKEDEHLLVIGKNEDVNRHMQRDVS